MSAAVSTSVLDRYPGPGWSCEDRVVDLPSVRLHYLDVRRDGTEPGAAVRTGLLLHGMSSHADAWRMAIPELTSLDRLVCLDQRGHGFSDWTPDGYWLKDYARDAVALLDALGLNQVDLVGHSLGARVAMVLGAVAPLRLRTVTLSDTGPEVSREAALKARGIASTQQAARGFSDENALRTWLQESHPHWRPETFDIRVARLYRSNWVGKLVHRGDEEVTWLLGRAGLAEVEDMWEGLRRLPCPVLIVRGTRSFLLDGGIATRMQECLAHPTLVELDLTHDMLYEDPALFGRTVNAFLRGT